MILTKKKTKFDSFLLTNLVFAFFPIAFILGNLFVNIGMLLITLFGILFYKNKLFTFGKSNLLVFISFFFIILIVSTVLEDVRSENNHLTKSILYLRYLFFGLFSNPA